MLRGVNICGAEFGASVLPGIRGQHYQYPSDSTFGYFASRGLTLIRLPVRWERLQNDPGAGLDEGYTLGLEEALGHANQAGCRVIVDLHNYGRYGDIVVGTPELPGTVLAGLWLMLSRRLRFHPAVYGYGLMNEPHDMGRADWKAVSQEVVTAIRGDGDTRLILVPGDGWSSAEHWEKWNGPRAWIEDPAENHAYEAHQYFDSDGSGTYRLSYDEHAEDDPALAGSGVRRVRPFLGWLRANGVHGYLGEYGVPGDDPRWLEVLEGFLSELDAAGVDGTYWAAGEWWGEYRLSVQPRFGTDTPQLATLLRHV